MFLYVWGSKMVEKAIINYNYALGRFNTDEGRDPVLTITQQFKNKEEAKKNYRTGVEEKRGGIIKPTDYNLILVKQVRNEIGLREEPKKEEGLIHLELEKLIETILNENKENNYDNIIQLGGPFEQGMRDILLPILPKTLASRVLIVPYNQIQEPSLKDTYIFAKFQERFKTKMLKLGEGPILLKAEPEIVDHLKDEMKKVEEMIGIMRKIKQDYGLTLSEYAQLIILEDIRKEFLSKNSLIDLELNEETKEQIRLLGLNNFLNESNE